MRLQQILNSLGNIAMVVAFALLIPTAYAWAFNEPTLIPFIKSAGLSLIAALALKANKAPATEFGTSEGFIIVSLAWVICSALGCLPFWFTGLSTSVTDVFFEAMSGFTTTGATVFSGLDNMPKSIILWRALTQWIGGMGIVVLMLAIFPMLGSAAFQIYKAEVPGPTSERIKPKIKDSAKMLWLVYCLFTLCECLILGLTTEMPWIDAVCISFSSLATGGFAPHDSSLAFWNSPYIEAVVTVFMFLGGINFMLHYQALRGSFKPMFTNLEFKIYTLTILLASLLIGMSLYISDDHTILNSIRLSVFQVVSIMSTTGFSTADFNIWPVFTQLTLVLLMLTGACAGSTSGGIKLIRYIVSLKGMMIEIKRTVFPSLVKLVKIANSPVDKNIVNNIVYFFFLYFLVFLTGTLGLTLLGMDLISSSSASISCLSNIGPGLNTIGPANTYASVPEIGKWILSALMLIGRLEIYCVLVLLFPSTWRD